MRQVFPAMGTVVSLEASGMDAEALQGIERIFADADGRFSLYRHDSDLSRINAGRAALLDADPVVREAFALASEWRLRTGGAFTPIRPDGAMDLNGVVKALAMAEAADALDRAGCRDWTLTVGGDLVTSGCGPGGEPWTTGIVDPLDRTALLCAVELHAPRRAIATSGTSERGDHIWKAGLTSSFAQVTVVADDIITADVLATAIVAGGEPMLHEACEGWSIDVLTIDDAGELRATPGFRAALAVPA